MYEGTRPTDALLIAEELTPIIERLRSLAGQVEDGGGNHFPLDSAAIDLEEYAAWLEEQ